VTSIHQKSIKIAAAAASRAHHGQVRKNGKIPSIVHPGRVAERVRFFGGNHVAIIAAWLHDVIEDCDEGNRIVCDTLRQLELPQEQREEIFAIVSALTKNDAIPGKSDRQADTLERINQAPPQAILVKLCDRMDNLYDAWDREQTFLAIYLSLTDQLIDTLFDGAVNHGYVRALETLKALRKTFSAREGGQNLSVHEAQRYDTS
jgi:(p)ppGpp synthase/HD superfamily hydrolase